MTALDLSQLVDTYIKIRDKRGELKHKYEEQDKKLKSDIEVIKTALLAYCKQQNVESVNTSKGSFYRTTREFFWTKDWNAMFDFIREHGCPELLNKKLVRDNIKTFREEHPDLDLPGLQHQREYGLQVRRSE